MIARMLGHLFKSLFAYRSGPIAQLPADVPQDGDRAESTRHYHAAKASVRAGRVAEAIASCRAALMAERNFSPAHFLLAEIELPGEDYLEVLARVHGHLRPRTYLEIGVETGRSIRQVGPGTRAIGVDPHPRVEFDLGPNVSIVPQTSSEFFARHDVLEALGGVPIDMAFIDGMHQFEYALRDFMSIEALCTPASTIFIHDVFPLDEHTATRQRGTGFWSGDIWRLALLLRKHRPDLAFHTIAAKPTGLAIVRNLDPASRYIRDHLDELIEEYLEVDFSILNDRKAESLALVPNDWSRISALLDAPVTPRL